METNFIHYIPIGTTIFSTIFFIIIYKHWSGKKKAMHLFWWMLGVATFGAGTLTESIYTLYGYHDVTFKVWYIVGALLGGAPLAQGTIYLLMKKKTADQLTIALVSLIVIASVFVILSPIDPEMIERARPTGKVFEWQWG